MIVHIGVIVALGLRSWQTQDRDAACRKADIDNWVVLPIVVDGPLHIEFPLALTIAFQLEMTIPKIFAR
jgi:hypothetical protein